jgi:ubiquitin C-terminal hydrolase
MFKNNLKLRDRILNEYNNLIGGTTKFYIDQYVFVKNGNNKDKGAIIEIKSNGNVTEYIVLLDNGKKETKLEIYLEDDRIRNLKAEISFLELLLGEIKPILKPSALKPSALRPLVPSLSASSGPKPSAPSSAPSGPKPSAPSGPKPSAPSGPKPSAPSGPKPSAPSSPSSSSSSSSSLSSSSSKPKPSSSKGIAAPCKGLTNIGNTCFMNSALQLFYSMPEFKAIILAEPPTKIDRDYKYTDIPPLKITDANKNNPDILKNIRLRQEDRKRVDIKKANVVIQSLKSIFTELNTSKESAIHPGTTIRDILETIGEKVGHQQDASEALNASILSKLQESPLPSIQRLMNLYKFNYVEILRCETGEEISTDFSKPTRNQFEYRLEVPLRDTLQNSINAFLGVERVTDPSNFLEWCKKPHTKQNNIVFNPEVQYLIIALKRMRQGYVLDNRVSIVNGIINIPNFRNAEIPNIRFALQGCIYYTGIGRYGHYQYLEFDKTGNLKPIRLYNDSLVSENPSVTPDIRKIPNTDKFIYKDKQKIENPDYNPGFNINTNGYVFLFRRIA